MIVRRRREAMKFIVGAPIGLAVAASDHVPLSASQAKVPTPARLAEGRFVNFSQFAGFEAAASSGIPVHFDPGEYAVPLMHHRLDAPLNFHAAPGTVRFRLREDGAGAFVPGPHAFEVSGIEFTGGTLLNFFNRDQSTVQTMLPGTRVPLVRIVDSRFIDVKTVINWDFHVEEDDTRQLDELIIHRVDIRNAVVKGISVFGSGLRHFDVRDVRVSNARRFGINLGPGKWKVHQDRMVGGELHNIVCEDIRAVEFHSTGIGLQGRNITASNLRCENVRRKRPDQKSKDLHGIYMKVVGFRGTNFELIDCTGREAALNFKGGNTKKKKISGGDYLVDDVRITDTPERRGPDDGQNAMWFQEWGSVVRNVMVRNVKGWVARTSKTQPFPGPKLDNITVIEPGKDKLFKFTANRIDVSLTNSSVKRANGRSIRGNPVVVADGLVGYREWGNSWNLS